MKVEQIDPKPAFKPVVITLESQEEVDAIYAVLNHGPLSKCLEPAFPDDAFEKLNKFKSMNYTEYHHRLELFRRP